jgi:hypothetical protein
VDEDPFFSLFVISVMGNLFRAFNILRSDSEEGRWMRIHSSHFSLFLLWAISSGLSTSFGAIAKQRVWEEHSGTSACYKAEKLCFVGTCLNGLGTTFISFNLITSLNSFNFKSTPRIYLARES